MGKPITVAMAKSAARVFDEIFTALCKSRALVWDENDTINGVCPIALNVKVEFNKSVFQPVERMEKRTVGQFFTVRAVAVPKEGEPDLSPTEAEAEMEREHAVICIAASSAEEALLRLRARGLPL